jgi:hypothetical protein
MSLPGLNLSFEKRSSTALSSANTNDNSSKNNNNITLNIINDLEWCDDDDITKTKSPMKTPKATYNTSPMNTPKLNRKSTLTSITSAISPFPSAGEEDVIKNKEYKSPDFSDIETDFKNQLLSFTTDLLLCDFDLIRNIVERSNKVIFHTEQLKMLIAILYLSKEDRNRYDSLIEIETEPIVINNCFCKNCNHPFILKIKSIYVNKSTNFLTTSFAVNMTSTFRISLEYTIKDKLINA